MPRKTKDQKEIENEGKSKKTIEKSQPKKTTTKKATTSKTTSKTKTKKTSKITTSKKTTTAKKAATKTTSKKTSTTTTKAAKKQKPEVVEYYDLPYRYNQTIVKLLAQTPTTLFIYWDISDKDRKNFEKQYGSNFFETTKPVLIIYNETLGYKFEIEINDFANSWYLHVADSKCNYHIELGRRPIIENNQLNTDYIYVTSSNKIESPNDKILLDKKQNTVYFKNVKTGAISQKPITSISFIKSIGKIYNIYDIYKTMYQNENIEEIFDLSNPSSGNPSSGIFFSKF